MNSVLTWKKKKAGKNKNMMMFDFIVLTVANGAMATIMALAVYMINYCNIHH